MAFDQESRRITTALGWYPSGYGLTDAQTMAVVEQVRGALRDSRISPADLGIGGEYRPPTIRLQDVTDRALLVELQRRLALHDGGSGS